MSHALLAAAVVKYALSDARGGRYAPDAQDFLHRRYAESLWAEVLQDAGIDPRMVLRAAAAKEPMSHGYRVENKKRVTVAVSDEQRALMRRRMERVNRRRGSEVEV